MFAKRMVVLIGVLVLCVAVALAAVSCQQQQQAARDKSGPDADIFGNGYLDNTPVIARVGDLEITQRDLDLRYEELPSNAKQRFSGDGWEVRFLHYMVDEALIVQEAQRRKLDRDPKVSQMLISQRREVLKGAMRNYALMQDKQPTEEQLRHYFELNKDKYMREGFLHARHIPCRSREAANEVYDQLRQHPDDERVWGLLVAQFSTNHESAKQVGDLGWFSRDGFIPALPYGKDFARAVWDWRIGLHEPSLIGNEWQVIEVLGRELERPFTFEEVRDRVAQDFLPTWQDDEVSSWLRQAKQTTAIEYFGIYRPGKGMNEQELFERAWYAGTPEQKIDYYNQLLDDYPQSDLADDALFLLANLYMDTWSDIPQADRILHRLVEDYPHSDLYDDAQYFLEHLGDPNFRKPRSIEDLKPKQK